MSRDEVRAAFSLGAIFALRMLGLFSILPVFAVHAPQLQGGDDLRLVGWGLGIYGLTQGFLQVPYGMAADRFGRKRTIMIGLLVFAAGSFLAATAQDIWTVIAGRAIQGAGAISAAVMALAADLTAEEHRTKTMAVIGGSIGLMFALALVGAPALYQLVSLNGIFIVVGILSLLAIVVLYSAVPKEPAKHAEAPPPPPILEVACNVELLRLNLGIFVLHVAQMAMFVVVPRALVDAAGIPLAHHWMVYLPVVLLSFVLMLPPLVMAEKRGRAKALFLGAILVLLAVEVIYSFGIHHLYGHIALLLAFFVAFNILEASLPSLVSRIAPPAAKGTALGIYNTTQSLGLAVGGAAGGILAKAYGDHSVFVLGAVLALLWLAVAARMNVPPPRRAGLRPAVPAES